MVLKSFNGGLLHAYGLPPSHLRALSIYLFLGTSFENVLTAFVLLGAVLRCALP